MKMYILILDDVEDGNAIVAASHGSLMCYLQFQHNPNMIEWLSGSFKKVVCRVNDSELERAKEECEFVVITESSLGGRVVGIAILPQKEFSKSFKYFKLWK